MGSVSHAIVCETYWIAALAIYVSTASMCCVSLNNVLFISCVSSQYDCDFAFSNPENIFVYQALSVFHFCPFCFPSPSLCDNQTNKSCWMYIITGG